MRTNSGSPSGDGSRSAPYATIQAAITAADLTGTGTDVYVAAGNYNESLDLRSRVSIYGGWEEVNWTRDIAAHRPVVSGSATAVTGDQVADLTIEGLEIIAASATGGAGLSSVAVWLDRTDQILLTRNVLRAGNGTVGTHGTRGTLVDGGDLLEHADPHVLGVGRARVDGHDTEAERGEAETEA